MKEGASSRNRIGGSSRSSAYSGSIYRAALSCTSQICFHFDIAEMESPLHPCRRDCSCSMHPRLLYGGLLPHEILPMNFWRAYYLYRDIERSKRQLDIIPPCGVHPSSRTCSIQSRGVGLIARSLFYIRSYTKRLEENFLD